MEAVEILNTAANLVGGDRAKTHGDKVGNHTKIANLWNAYISNKYPALALPHPFDATDVAQMMILLKIARTQSGGTHNPDNYVDAAGYAGVAGECAKIERV